MKIGNIIKESNDNIIDTPLIWSVFHSHFKQLFCKYYGYDVQFKGLNIAESLSLIEAMKY